MCVIFGLVTRVREGQFSQDENNVPGMKFSTRWLIVWKEQYSVNKCVVSQFHQQLNSALRALIMYISTTAFQRVK